MKVQSTGIATGTATGGHTSRDAGRVGQPHPFSVVLFGRRPPRRLDPRRFPGLRRTLRKLDAVKDEIAQLAGQLGGALELSLAEGDNACINERGELLLGQRLLEEHKDDDDLLVAVLGHEIGHAPWSWPSALPPHLTGAQRSSLLREEEAKADRFAGRVLADLGGDPEALCRLLLRDARFEKHPPFGYYPAEVRVEQLRGAFSGRLRALKAGRAALPGMGHGGRPLR